MANKLDLADAQFIGFAHGKWHRSDIIGLIQGMGLTRKEWEKWKRDYDGHYLTEDEHKEIEEYFNQPQKAS